MVIFRNGNKSGYNLLFNQNTGTFIRFSKNGIEPFWNKLGPELLDISITNFCTNGCRFCYRGSNESGIHMSLEEYIRIIREASQCGVLQVALGGGNPNQHPQFIDILRITREEGIIPSYTTNGEGMTDLILEATKKYCGSFAISWYYPYEKVLQIISKANTYDIPVNIHYVLSMETLDSAIELLNRRDILEKVNSIIFLCYKPVVNGGMHVIQDDEKLDVFLSYVVNNVSCKIGFDSCMISYLAKIKDMLMEETVDFCESSRFSAFIREDSVLFPCSFMSEKFEGIDLRKISLHDAWCKSKQFIYMREVLKNKSAQKYSVELCLTCEMYDFCHGGCPVFNINRCREMD